MAEVISDRSRRAATAARGSPAKVRSSTSVWSEPLAAESWLTRFPSSAAQFAASAGSAMTVTNEVSPTPRNPCAGRAAQRAASETARAPMITVPLFTALGPEGAGAGTKTGTATVAGASLRPSLALPESSQV